MRASPLGDAQVHDHGQVVFRFSNVKSEEKLGVSFLIRFTLLLRLADAWPYFVIFVVSNRLRRNQTELQRINRNKLQQKSVCGTSKSSLDLLDTKLCKLDSSI